jgi:hypothetical protein
LLPFAYEVWDRLRANSFPTRKEIEIEIMIGIEIEIEIEIWRGTV